MGEYYKDGLRLNTEPIVDSVPKSLLAAQISLRRPNSSPPASWQIGH